MAKYIDPIYDSGFKFLFGRENISEPILIDLLNALLANTKGFEEITSIKYLNTERQSEWLDGKGIRYDILCETAKHHRFIVEMQKARQTNFIDRATFYVARGIAEQGYKGKDEYDNDWDYSLNPVIGIFLCNFHVPNLEQKYITRASTMDEETFKPIGAKTRYIFIQLPFFNKEEAQCNNLEDQWIYNIKNMGIRQEVAFKNNSAVFKRLATIADVASLTPDQRRIYDADVKIARDTLNQIRTAYNDGSEKGFEKGFEKGLEKGIMKSASRLLAGGLDPDFISNCLGLPIETVLNLRQTLSLTSNPEE